MLCISGVQDYEVVGDLAGGDSVPLLPRIFHFVC